MENSIMYGVWIPGTGWLRGDQSRALMFAEKTVAQETAERIGKRAKAYFIDQSLVDIEGQLLDAEKQVYGFPLTEWIRALKR